MGCSAELTPSNRPDPYGWGWPNPSAAAAPLGRTFSNQIDLPAATNAAQVRAAAGGDARRSILAPLKSDPWTLLTNPSIPLPTAHRQSTTGTPQSIMPTGGLHPPSRTPRRDGNASLGPSCLLLLPPHHYDGPPAAHTPQPGTANRVRGSKLLDLGCRAYGSTACRSIH